MTNEEIDAEVLDYIERHPFHQPYRLVDHSLQRLRKKGRVEFSTDRGRRGWIAKR